METILIKENRAFLYLPSSNYKQKRFLGYIQDNTFYTIRKSKNHLLKINNSLGFNYELIKNGNFDFVCVNYDYTNLWTLRKTILENGKCYKFSKGTLELQIFLPLHFFKNDKSELEAELNKPVFINQNLFQ